MAVPKIDFAVVCDDAFFSEESKKLNIIGLYQKVIAGQVPALHPKLTAVAAFEPIEKDQKFNLKARILKKGETNAIVELAGDIQLRENNKFQAILSFSLIKFESYGEYYCEVFLDDKSMIKIPFEVANLKE